jgi:hypothetical protein
MEQSDFVLSERGAAVVKAAAATTLVRSDSVLSRDEDDDDGVDDIDNYEHNNHQSHDHDQHDVGVIEDDEDYDSHAAEQILQEQRRKDRAMSFVYMEEVSMEAALQDYPGDEPGHAGLHQTHTGSGESVASSGVSGGSLTKVMPSGRLGRRRPSGSESDMILVVDEDLEGFSSSQSHLEVETEEEGEEHKVYEQLNEHLKNGQEQDLEQSERDVFQTVQSEQDVLRTVPETAVFQPNLETALIAEPPPEPMPVTTVTQTSCGSVDVSRHCGRARKLKSPRRQFRLLRRQNFTCCWLIISYLPVYRQQQQQSQSKPHNNIYNRYRRTLFRVSVARREVEWMSTTNSCFAFSLWFCRLPVIAKPSCGMEWDYSKRVHFALPINRSWSNRTMRRFAHSRSAGNQHC